MSFTHVQPQGDMSSHNWQIVQAGREEVIMSETSLAYYEARSIVVVKDHRFASRDGVIKSEHNNRA